MSPSSKPKDDPVRPDHDQVARIVSQSERSWFSSIASTINQEDLPDFCFRPSNVLTKVPAIPDGSLSLQEGRLKKAVDSDHLVAFGHSSWEITGCKECGLGGSQKDTECCPIILGVRKATLITSHAEWNCYRKGVITAIITAIAYIFCKRLVELQGQGDDTSLSSGRVYYTENTATVLEDEKQGSAAPPTDVYIGEVDDDASRWWQSLLAPGQGWKAEVAADNAGPFLAPWAVEKGEELSFQIRRTGSGGQTSGVSPPSAIRAKEYLYNFCRIHNVKTEFSAAIATALMLPIHNLYSLSANLQWRLFNNPHSQETEINDIQYGIFWNNIAHYLTVGCHPRGVISNLCGAFWEPEIPCNLAHAWLYPPCELLPHVPGIDGVTHLYHQALVRECATRRPNLASLFLGASLTGLMPIILHFVKSGLPVIDLDAAAWVNCEQSFIQNSGQAPPNSRNCMLRADVWRLLYITGEYPNPPLTPWKPFGEMSLQDIPL